MTAAALALARDGDLDDQAYAAAVAELGLRPLVALTTLVGYYATLALQLRVFRVPAPDGAAGAPRA
jgi:4-carboxymuconolactone decarboxylase